MLHKFLFLICLPTSLSISCFAYKKKAIAADKVELSLSFVGHSKLQGAQLALGKTYFIGSKKRTQFTLGGRFGSYFSSAGLAYTTAPPSIVTGKSGFSSYFVKENRQNIDTLIQNKTQVNTLNLMLAFRHQLYKSFWLELHADLLGFSFGGRKKGILYFGDDPIFSSVLTETRVSSTNLRLPSKHTFGTSLYGIQIRYQHNTTFSMSLGLSWITLEYLVQQPVNYINTQGINVNTDRYAYRTMLGNLTFSKVI